MKSNRLTTMAALLCAAIFFAPATPLLAETSPAEQQLNTVMEEYWDFVLRESPLTATGAGVSDYNDRLSSVTPDSQARRNDAEKLYLARTRDIDHAALSQSGLVNAELFEWVLEVGRVPDIQISSPHIASQTDRSCRSLQDHQRIQ